jgi:hypothetical protein
MIIAIIGEGPLAALLGQAWSSDRHVFLNVAVASEELSHAVDRADIVRRIIRYAKFRGPEARAG